MSRIIVLIVAILEDENYDTCHNHAKDDLVNINITGKDDAYCCGFARSLCAGLCLNEAYSRGYTQADRWVCYKSDPNVEDASVTVCRVIIVCSRKTRTEELPPLIIANCKSVLAMSVLNVRYLKTPFEERSAESSNVCNHDSKAVKVSHRRKILALHEPVDRLEHPQLQYFHSVNRVFVGIVILANMNSMPNIPFSVSETFVKVDIPIQIFAEEEALFVTIKSNSSTKYFCIFNSSSNTQHLMERLHSCSNVVYLYTLSETEQLEQQRRITRSYAKFEAVYDDILRLLIKVASDVALFCEETADRQRSNKAMIDQAKRNYQRALELYAFVETTTSNSELKCFPDFVGVEDYICSNVKEMDSFIIWISDQCVEQFIQSRIIDFPQLKRANIYFSTEVDMASVSRYYAGRYSKLSFCLASEVSNRLRQAALGDCLSSSSLLDRDWIKSTMTRAKQGVSQKMASLEIELHTNAHSSDNGGKTSFLNGKVPANYLCTLCSGILRDPVQLMCCGSRICEPCVLFNNGSTTCPECQRIVTQAEALVLNSNFFRGHSSISISLPAGYRPNSLKFLRILDIPLSIFKRIPGDHLQEHYCMNMNDAATTNLNQMRLQEAMNNPLLEPSNLIYEEKPITSSEGTLTWNVTDARSKIAGLTFERGTSIDSPIFYTSPTGYKMLARLFSYGNDRDSRAHLSVFLTLLQGEYDAILRWPFPYNVACCLFDQTNRSRHIIDMFRPDTNSISFQRPCSDTNVASGIRKFCPLALLQNEDSPYIIEDTMFIKITVDFVGIPHELLPDMFKMDPGLPPHVQHSRINDISTNFQAIQSTHVAEILQAERQISQNAQRPLSTTSPSIQTLHEDSAASSLSAEYDDEDSETEQSHECR
ncbi:unnamed protein product [Adineta ricciae]|uniref:Uncharacterized protein n=1 Tax=Adineta ricciae TaxID=249248 RepID=A0A814KJM5_ADIRI|nr:unnamed protein product [Adineta ricciae]